MKSYAAIVLYYRLGPKILDTLDALRAQTLKPEEIVLVDNASGDGMMTAVRAAHPDVTVVDLERNAGYAGGMNAGVAAATTAPEALLFLTHETSMEPGCAERLIGGLSSQVVQTAPRLIRASTGAIWSVGGEIGRLGRPRHATSGLVGPATWVDGACVAVGRDAFASIGGFDERFFLYWEDIDLSLRLGALGRVEVIEKAVAYQDTATMPSYYASRNGLLVWRKHRLTKTVLGFAFYQLAKSTREVLGGDLRSGLARARGVVHGMVGREGPEHA